MSSAAGWFRLGFCQIQFVTLWGSKRGAPGGSFSGEFGIHTLVSISFDGHRPYCDWSNRLPRRKDHLGSLPGGGGSGDGRSDVGSPDIYPAGFPIC